MHKRKIAILLLSCMLIFTLTNCKKANTTKSNNSGSSENPVSTDSIAGSDISVNAESTSGSVSSNKTTASTKSNTISKSGTTTHPGLQKYASPVTLTTFRKTSDDIERNLAKTTAKETIDYNRYNRWYEETLNVKLKNLWVAKGDNYTQKLTLALSSGQLPDVFLVNAIQVENLYKAGKIQGLSKVYNNYATDETKAIMQSDATKSDTFDAVTYKGELYGIPRTWSSYDSAEFLWVRTDWLKKYSLPEPTTIQNVVQIAKRLAKEDPDGNGKLDTIGLGIQKVFNGNAGGIVGFINGYHGYLDLFLKKDGKVIFSDIQPQVKSALLSLNDLYKSGAISKEFGTTDLSILIEKITSGKIGMFYGEHWMPLNVVYNNWVLDEKAVWKSYPIPSVDNEPAKNQIYTGTTEWFVVNKNCKNPEAIVKLINVAYKRDRPEYVTRKDVVDSWSFNPIFMQDPMVNINQMHSMKDYIAGKKIDDITYQSSHIDEYKLYKQGKLQYWWAEQIYGISGCPIEILESDYIKNNKLIRTAFRGNPTDSMVKNGATLDKLVDETFTEMIVGTKSGKDFDDFTNQWLNLGGQKILNEIAASGKP